MNKLLCPHFGICKKWLECEDTPYIGFKGRRVLTNQNLECGDDDDEVYYADSDESGTDAIYYGNVCVIHI